MCNCYLANPLALHNKCLHLREIVVVRDHISDDGLFVWVFCVYICIRERWQRQKSEKLTSA